jgi:hypothetical protein
MPKSQQSRVRFQHPPTQWSLRAADEAVLNTVHEKKYKKKPVVPASEPCNCGVKKPSWELWLNEKFYLFFGECPGIDSLIMGYLLHQ